MYRRSFSKSEENTKKEVFHRVNTNNSTDSYCSSNEDASPVTPISPPLFITKKESIKNTISFSSTDSAMNEDIETTERMLNETKRLSLEARQLLCQTFRPMEVHPIRCGLNIMIGLFSEHPQYKNIWPKFKQIPDSSLMNAPELKKHAATYMRGLRTIIENLDDEEKMTKALRKIAYAHVKWNIYKKHIIHMLEPVLQQVQIHNGSMSPAVENAWTTLFDVIANLVDIFRTSEAANVRENIAHKDRIAIYG